MFRQSIVRVDGIGEGGVVGRRRGGGKKFRRGERRIQNGSRTRWQRWNKVERMIRNAACACEREKEINYVRSRGSECAKDK